MKKYTYDELPQNVKDLIGTLETVDETYETCKDIQTALNSIGWDCDYGLDAVITEFWQVGENPAGKENTIQNQTVDIENLQLDNVRLETENQQLREVLRDLLEDVSKSTDEVLYNNEPNNPYWAGRKLLGLEDSF